MVTCHVLFSNISRWLVTAATDVQKVLLTAGFSRGVFLTNLYYITSLRIKTAV
jgi:hypothetical protein